MTMKLLERKFNIFQLVIFIAERINFSTGTVIHERFLKERGSLGSRRRIKGEMREHDSGRWSVIKEIQNMMEYHQIGPMLLIINFTQVLMLTYFSIKSILYASLSHKRNPLTNQLLNPVLRFMEEHYIIDYIFIIKQSRQMNRLAVFMTARYLILRVRRLYAQFKTARINRFIYKKISCVDLAGYYMKELSTNLHGWIKLISDGTKHECKKIERGWRTQEMTDRLDKMDKIDRLYYYNLLDYNECLEGIDLMRETKPYDQKKHLNVTGSKLDRWKRLISEFFTIIQPYRRLHIPTPIHRFDQKYFFILFRLSLLVTVAFINTTIVACSAILANLRYLGMDAFNLQSTFYPAFHKWIHSSLSIIATFEETAVIFLININLMDQTMVGLASVACQARIAKVLMLLEHEVAFFRNQTERYLSIAIAQNIDLNSIPILKDDDYARGVKASLIGFMKHTLRMNLGNTKQMMTTSDESELELLNKSIVAGGGGGGGGRRRSKAGHCSRGSLQIERSPLRPINALNEQELICKNLYEFNENIRYLLHLIGILLDELNDMKTQFTFTLNISIVLGTIGTAVSFGLLLASDDMLVIIVVIGAMIVELAPLLLTLALGATAASGFRRICHLLTPLLANEAKFIELSNLKRIQNMYEYLACEENRAFVLLSSFPLTYGLVGSITGWMVTSNLLLQRFFI